MSGNWLKLITSIPPRVVHTGDTALQALRDAGQLAGRQLDSGWHLAKELSAQASENSQRVGRSARQLVAQRPVESVLLVAGAAFAIGWLVAVVRRQRETAAPARPARPRVKARTAK